MTRCQKLVSTLTITTFFFVPLLLLAFSSGPDPGNTAGPDENPQGCARAGCHVGSLNTDQGIEIDFPQQLTYTPGVKQRWRVRVTAPAAAGYGFQASVRTSTGGQAGTVANLDNKTQILCLGGGAANAPCRPESPVQYITHTAVSNQPQFEFEWTPPANDIGPVRVFVAANAANMNGTTAGDRIYLRNFTLQPQAAANQPQIREASPVLQAFSGTPVVSAGTWVEIYGQNLAAETREWAGGDFAGNRAPTTLGGVRVRVAGKDAFVRYVSPTQVNVQVPDDIGVGDAIPLEVENAAGVARTTVRAQKVSPALLTTPLFNVGGRRYVAALHTDFRTFVGRENLIAGVPFRPAKPGDSIIIFAVGCGGTTPGSPAGQFFPEARPLSSPFEIRFGQTGAQAQGFLAAQAVGLCQFNVVVPNVANGDIALSATVDGVADGQDLFTTIQQ